MLPSLIFPAAVNCCVAPAATDAVAGVTSTADSVGAGTVIVTSAVSALVPPAARRSRDSPRRGPRLVEPGRGHRPAGGGIGHRHRPRAPVTHLPRAVNCCVAPAATDAVPGVSTTEDSVGDPGAVVTDPTVTMVVSATGAARRESTTRAMTR